MVPNLHFQVKHRWHKAGSVLQYLDKPKGVFGWPEFDHFVGKSCSFHAKTTIAEKKHGTSKSPVLKRNIHLPNGVPCQFSKVDGCLNYQKKYSPKGVLLETRHSDSPKPGNGSPTITYWKWRETLFFPTKRKDWSLGFEVTYFWSCNILNGRGILDIMKHKSIPQVVSPFRDWKQTSPGLPGNGCQNFQVTRVDVGYPFQQVIGIVLKIPHA